MRPVQVASLQAVNVTYFSVPKIFLSRLSMAAGQSPGQRARRALAWTVHQVRKVGPSPMKDPLQEPADLLSYVNSGGGALCSGMAVLFLNALSAVDVPARIVSLQRNAFDGNDSHVTVEVRMNGKWVVMDPTFNLSFADTHGELLSAQDIHVALLAGTSQNITPIHYAVGIYPARLETYGLNYLPLYNNVFVLDPGGDRWLSRLPPFRYWLGPKLYYEKSPAESVSHLEFMQRLYFLLVVVLPSASIIVFAITVYRAVSCALRLHLGHASQGGSDLEPLCEYDPCEKAVQADAGIGARIRGL